jgi:hypothetical protein
MNLHEHGPATYCTHVLGACSIAKDVACSHCVIALRSRCRVLVMKTRVRKDSHARTGSTTMSTVFTFVAADAQ